MKEFGGRLAVAALGAVPKEQGSSAVRLIHDGSYSVDVNRRIRVRDRLRFPLIDDAAAVLIETERASRGAEGPQRFSMVYDISRAHKLIPIVRRDWGLQAFRLPGKHRPGKIFVHTRGTFGIGSAAYWWGRVASGVIRAGHRLGGQGLGLLHLLFADDGWMVATGSGYWKKLLFWLFVLELLEVPLSWKKVKGGTRVQWIGYQLCVETYRKGISEKKVKWVEDWVLSGGATGREMKSALGRLTFVAGALQMLRPFLGPMFSWTAVLRGGAFSKFPGAVHILLKFVVKCVQDEPMTVARSIPMSVEDVFRVDAKAEKDKIVLGGWESYGGIGCGEARWFSLELTRRSAPWAYIKGEPFRAIAALELAAILAALILFGKGAPWAGRRSRMLISAFTDNMGNSFLVSKFLSCKYPLSIVLMEVACQLKKLNVEMDLGWIPRNENEEADSLTNSEFGEFDEGKRIEASFENLDFIVLKELMEEAGKLDEEINLARSSREAKEMKLRRERSPKAKKGEIRWKDPWWRGRGKKKVLKVSFFMSKVGKFHKERSWKLRTSNKMFGLEVNGRKEVCWHMSKQDSVRMMRNPWKVRYCLQSAMTWNGFILERHVTCSSVVQVPALRSHRPPLAPPSVRGKFHKERSWKLRTSNKMFGLEVNGRKEVCWHMSKQDSVRMMRNPWKVRYCLQSAMTLLLMAEIRRSPPGMVLKPYK